MFNSVSVTDLKQNTAQIIRRIKREGQSLVILQRSKAAAFLVEPQYYEILESALEDLSDLKAIEESKKDSKNTFEKYFTKRFGKAGKKLAK